MADKKKSEVSRNWNYIVYPESAPKNWRSILDDTHVRWIESPLHDMDVNPDGEKKKPHWHIMIMFDSIQRESAANKLAVELNSPHPEIARSPRGMVRYMYHRDNPEKYQYNKSDIIPHNGADNDLQKFLEQSLSEKEMVLDEIENYIFEKKISTFSQLVRHAKVEHPEWMPTLRNGSTIYLTALITGIWQEKKGNL